MVADDDVGTLFAKPADELLFVPITIRDQVHGHALALIDAILVGEETTGVMMLDTFIDTGTEGEADPFVAAFVEAA